jgi:hypothetical protein
MPRVSPVCRSLCFNCGVRGSQPGGLIGVRVRVAAVRGAAVTAATLAALAWQPTVGGAEVITTSGPLSSIYVENNLDCQIQASGDTSPSFFGGTVGGGCGTFLALTEGQEVPVADTLFGPNPAASSFAAKTEYTSAGAQTLTGHGTASEPYVITTRVYAEEPASAAPVKVAELTETDSYVTGQESYETTIVVDNLGTKALKGTLYHVGDCFLANVDTGYGAENVPSTGSVACTITPNDVPPARFMAFTPIATEGFPVNSASHVESVWPTFWEYVKPNGEQLPNKIDATTNEDNGMGLSWPISLKVAGSPGHEATLKLTTTVSPDTPLRSSTSAPSASPGGVCVSNEKFPVTISAVNGAEALHYKVDGGSEQTIKPIENSQASIPLTPGQHTLEYWAEDQAHVQENPHNTVTVLVNSGAPGLTITSEQGKSAYLVGEAASVAVAASGLDLTSNPSATHVSISTEAPGSFSVTRSATNPCGTTSASFAYTVTRATLANLPPPVLGKTVNVEPVSGEVFVKLPPGYASAADARLADPPRAAAPLEAALANPAGSLETATESLHKGVGFIPLREARQIPVGSTLDTTAGVARIATATATLGQQQSGDFGAGIFKLLQQRRQKGLTELDMIDNHSPQSCTTLGKARIAAKRLSSKVLGRLNASGHGHFTVRGRFSAATVRGTIWSVGDRCEGTLTHVTRGVVLVRDFRRRKTITLFTGQSYLAKAPHY